MRNLKKILALVLALVMSLSLMATAGAASFPDVDDDNPYATAIEVLDALKVFQGYKEDGTFRPDGKLNRAQAAVLVYRIATGDAEDKQVANYTEMANSQFTDLEGYNWAKGYINYCQNAKYVIGTSATTFDPGSDVTGYQLLVMLLRVLGYGQAGEFSNGRTWELETAKIAEREGILKNITTGDLGAAAPRQMVAEILFRGLLTDTVQYSIMTPDGYTKGETLGMREFKLEEIEGVVTGNEFADLKSTQVLDKGQTQLQTEDGLRNLAISTRITDIGESRYAYITGTKVLAMGDTGNNKVTTFGHASRINTTALFNSTAEMPAASDIEYYEDFGRVGTYTCDQRIEFVVTFNTAGTGRTLAQLVDGFEDDYVRWDATTGNDLVRSVGMTVVAGVDPAVNPLSATVTYSKIIRAESDISDQDLDVIRGIFAAADNNNTAGTAYEGIEGDVFVGTYSNNVGTGGTTTDERDLSNKISYKKFFEEYINDQIFNINWNESFNGDWVKFIDNDGDGQAEYAFRTTSWLDEAIDTYTNKDGDTVTQFIRFNDDDTDVVNGWRWAVRYLDNDGKDTDTVPAVGDKVVCSLIDNQILVEPALDETVTVTDYNWKDDIITTDKGEYGQSFIGNATDMQNNIDTMDSKTQYIVYFDHFGYVRAYELPGGTQYTLITEIYAKNNQNGNLAQSWPMTVELVNKDADAAEYNLNGGSRSPFVSRSGSSLIWWNEVASLRGDYTYYNYLQPATAHYGVSTTGFAPTLASWTAGNGTYRFWSRNNQINQAIAALTPATNDVFNYGEYIFDAEDWREDATTGISPVTVSYTNVAVTNINDDSATLTGAAQLRRDRNGNILAVPDALENGDGIWQAGENARYAVDYVQLTKADVASGQTRYPISADYQGWQGNTIGDKANNYVSATHNTEYYIVYNGGVYYFTDYAKMPALTMADNNIRAAYAVAHDTSADNATAPYWVADVIVFEVEDWDDSSKTSTALVYYNPSRNENQVQLLEVLDNKNDPTMVNVVPTPLTWGADRGNFANYSGLGFYQLWDGEKQENGNLSVSDIIHIDGVDHSKHSSTTVHADGLCGNRAGLDLRWNSNLIFAGTVVNEVDVGVNGTYLNVDTNGDGITNVSLLIKNSASSNVYSITTDQKLGSGWTFNEATALRYNDVRSSEIKAGDRIVYIAGGKTAASGTQSASFVVDLGNQTNNWDLWNRTADFLADNYSAIAPFDPTTGLWADIMAEQTATPTPPTGVEDFSVNVSLGAWETAELTVNGEAFGDPVVCQHTGNAADGGAIVTGKVPNTTAFTLTIKITYTNPDTDPTPAVSVPAIVVPAGWASGTMVQTAVDTGTATYSIMIKKGASLTSMMLSEGEEETNPWVAASEAQARVYTQQGLEDLVEAINNDDIGLSELSTEEITAVKTVVTELDTKLDAGNPQKAALGTAKTAVDTAVGEAELADAKTAAETTVKNYLTEEKAAKLTTAQKETLAGAKTTALNGIADAADEAAVNSAVTTYTDAVDAAVDLADAKTTAVETVNGYLTEEKAAKLSDEQKETLAGAKTTALNGIADAADETAVDAAVTTYTNAVDAAIEAAEAAADAVQVKIVGTNVTLAEDQENILLDANGATINLVCPAGAVMPENKAAGVELAMVGATVSDANWTYTKNSDTSATVEIAFAQAITGNITIKISATAADLTDLENIAVAADGTITATNTSTTGLTVTYYTVAEAKVDDGDGDVIKTWNQLTPATAVADLEGTEVDTADKLTCADNDKWLVAVGVKDGKIVALGKSSAAIDVTESTLTLSSDQATIKSGATGTTVTVAAGGTAVTLNVAQASTLWKAGTDTNTGKQVATFSFTLTGGFVATWEDATLEAGGITIAEDAGTYTVTVVAAAAASTDIAIKVGVPAPATGA